MTRQVVAVVTLDESSIRVLLIRRADYRAWGLPGGKVEAGESYEQAAVRETFEETGCQVEIIRLVGIYHQPQFGDTRHIYCARAVGGSLIKNSRETLDVGWFLLNRLPTLLMPWTRQMIQDALAGGPQPVQKVVSVPTWQAAAANLLLRLRRASSRFR